MVDFFGMMQQPNAAYLGFANNHGIHHRGQLAAYLRAMGSKVPSHLRRQRRRADGA